MPTSASSTAREGVHASGGRPAIAASVSAVRLWGFALVAGIVAGLGSWACGEAFYGYVSPELHEMNLMGTPVMRPDLESIRVADVRNGSIAYAILGGILPLCLGLAGGLAQGRPRTAVRNGLAGAVCGMGIALTASWIGGQVYRQFYDAVAQNLGTALLLHGGMWSAIGAVGGATFATGVGGRGAITRGLTGGLVGGFLGAAIYELVGAAVFPMDKTFQPLSLTHNSRLLARMAVAICTALAAVVGSLITSAATPASQGAPIVQVVEP